MSRQHAHGRNQRRHVNQLAKRGKKVHPNDDKGRDA